MTRFGGEILSFWPAEPAHAASSRVRPSAGNTRRCSGNGIASACFCWTAVDLCGEWHLFLELCSPPLQIVPGARAAFFQGGGVETRKGQVWAPENHALAFRGAVGDRELGCGPHESRLASFALWMPRQAGPPGGVVLTPHIRPPCESHLRDGEEEEEAAAFDGLMSHRYSTVNVVDWLFGPPKGHADKFDSFERLPC